MILNTCNSLNLTCFQTETVSPKFLLIVFEIGPILVQNVIVRELLPVRMVTA